MTEKRIDEFEGKVIENTQCEQERVNRLGKYKRNRNLLI